MYSKKLQFILINHLACVNRQVSFNLNTLIQTRFNGRGDIVDAEKRTRGFQEVTYGFTVANLRPELLVVVPARRICTFYRFYDRFLRSINTYSHPYKSAVFSPEKWLKLSDYTIGIYFFPKLHYCPYYIGNKCTVDVMGFQFNK